MIYTLFFSRLRGGSTQGDERYERHAADLRERARRTNPGFVDLKTFVAEDGERLTIVRFTDEDAQQAWSRDPAHVEGQEKGRSEYYQQYRIVVCDARRTREWTLDT